MTTSPNAGIHRVVLGDQSQAVLVKILWTGSNILVILMLLWVGINQHQAANKAPAVFAIAPSGEKIPINEAKSDQEKMSIIQGFVDEVFTGIYTWKSDLPPSNLQESNKPVVDRGISIKNKKGQDIPIPTISFVSTMGLEPNLAKAFQQEIADYVSTYKIGPGNDKTSAVFIPRQTSQPISVGQDSWVVNIVGAQYIISKSKTTVVQHAYQVTLRAARVLTLSDAMKRYKNDADLAKHAVKTRTSGLEITKIALLGGNQ
jgi:hypothetical protein